MTTLVRSVRGLVPFVQPRIQGLTRRSLAVAALVALISLAPEGWAIALEAMSEAYLAVAVFVAGTLALVSYAESGLKVDLGTWLEENRHWQVPVATLLGAFPGCGGAIIAVSHYTRGYMSFGAVVATLIATMGDAIFLFLASEPQTALGVLVVSMVVGTATGFVVDRVHGRHFLRQSTVSAPIRLVSNTGARGQQRFRGPDIVWLSLMLPGAAIGISAAFRLEFDAFLVPETGIEVAHWLGVGGTLLALAMWAGVGESRFASNPTDVNCKRRPSDTLQAVIDTTNFVTSWVVFAFVGFELLVAVSKNGPRERVGCMGTGGPCNGDPGWLHSGLRAPNSRHFSLPGRLCALVCADG